MDEGQFKDVEQILLCFHPSHHIPFIEGKRCSLIGSTFDPHWGNVMERRDRHIELANKSVGKGGIQVMVCRLFDPLPGRHTIMYVGSFARDCGLVGVHRFIPTFLFSKTD